MIHNLTYKNVEQVSSLGEGSLRVFARLIAHQIDAVNATVAHSVRLAKPPDVTEVGTACSIPVNSCLVDRTSNDYPAWFETRRAVVGEDLRQRIPSPI